MNNRKMRKRMIWMLVCVGLLFAALYGYHMFGTYMMKKYLASNARPPATVTAMKAVRLDWQPSLHAIGSLRAVQGVNISAEVAGQVKRVYVQSGQTVHKGALLLELNHTDDDAQLHALEASAKLAVLNFARNKAQLKVRAISQASLDASTSELKRARAAVAQQHALIAKKRITAPFSGRLGIIVVNSGAYLSPGEVITSLQNTVSLFVDFHLPQKDLSKLSTGQHLQISTDAWPDRVFDGRITAISAEVDAATRNVRLEGRMDNPDGQLSPGMFVSLSVERGELRHYLTLPQTAISYNAYGATVFVAIGTAGKTATKTATKTAGKTKSGSGLIAQQEFVKLGPTRGDQVAILSGIKAGDLVVTSGLMKLKNGTPLLIDNTVQPANDPAPSPQEQ